MSDGNVTGRAIDTLRVLAAEAVQKANSGHPGMPMGCADYAFTLWSRFLRFDPENPDWLGRDRFVLSAGHGSMLLYGLLHLFGYDLTLEDLAQFRQWGSRTPGHPEFGHTQGVEVTTGPLGSGLASAVGMAIGLKQFAARVENPTLFDQRVYVLSSDGCMMEGTSHEACAIAGHQKLDNLVVFYDDNSITIEGPTSLAFSEDVGQRFAAYGWHVIRINGQETHQIESALKEAIAFQGRPKLIIGKTTIGFGAPTMQGSHEVHGAPLGEQELAATKQALGFDPETWFCVPDEVRELCGSIVADKKRAAAEWNRAYGKWRTQHVEKTGLLDALLSRKVPEGILDELLAAVPAKATATRNSGGEIMQRAAALVPALTGGAADLNPSTKTYLKAYPDFAPECRQGRNVHYGVRELGMGLCTNGLALTGHAIPFCSTFAVFADYMKPAIRLAAIQGLHEIFVFTHDSVFVGEDGPTHQPIEHLAMLRSIPGVTTIRPAESNEVAHAWAVALKAKGPVALFLTRQTVPNLAADQLPRIALAKGAYVLSEDAGFEVILIATGSEVGPALGAADLLRQEGRRVRVVSMPSWELFEAQPAAYRETVLPTVCRRRISVEAGTTFGWQRYVGCDGLAIGIDHFGASAPYETLASEYGLTAPAIAARALEYLKA
ncbi:MAG: transketolase [Lentisphaeria bacterium]|nr:transketolase [Lentisphaeria bacterium]